MSSFSSQIVDLEGIAIHFVHNAPVASDGSLVADGRPIMLLLHGFPEYHGAWHQLLPLLQEEYILIAPDQRGFGLSSAPQDVESYQSKFLVGDMIGLMAKLFPDKQYHLVGHDWGAAVAYALAMKQPDQVKTLTIINGMHPITFQRALINNVEQAKASQYFHVLCKPDAASHMAKDDYAKAFAMFEKFSSTPWLTPKLREKYLEFWSKPGRFNAMLNWYRSSPMVVPLLDQPAPPTPLLEMDPARFAITMPHLLLWGLEDTALLPVSRDGLAEFADDLRVVEIEDAGHWIVHTHPEFIAEQIRKFIAV